MPDWRWLDCLPTIMARGQTFRGAAATAAAVLCQISAHAIKGTSLTARAAETGRLGGHPASGLIVGQQPGLIR